MKLLLKPLGYALGTLLALSAASAQATLVEFFGEDLSPGGTVPAAGNAATARQAFLAALTGVGNEDFESAATGSIGAGLAISFPGSSGNITATLTGGGPGTINNFASSGRFATSPTQYLKTDAGQAFNIAFSSGISAFGFYGTDIGDFGGQISLQLTGGSNPLLNVGNSTNAPDGSLLFYGFIDDADSYTNIAFSNSSGTDVFGFDDMVVGDAGQVASGAPIPTTLALMGLGFAGIGFQRRRRNTSTTKG